MTLYPYQETGVQFLMSRRRAYLADGMGLGKTVQTAVAAKRCGVKSALVIAPASTVPNWHREWETWGPRCEFTAVSYSSSGIQKGLIDGSDYDLVVLDEAHYCKNPRAKRTLKALNIARAADRAWLLSGTPMPNHPGELWPPIRALWPEIPKRLGIKGYSHWYNKFTRYAQTRYGKRPYGVKNAAQLREIVHSIMLRRQIEDVSTDLPPLRIDVSLLPDDKDFEKALEEAGMDTGGLKARMDREDDYEEGSLSRLRRLLGQYKAPRIAKQLKTELEDHEYQQIVVLAYHRDVLDLLRSELGEFGVVGFDGSTPQAKRQQAIDAFKEDPANRVFVAQQTAAGIGINLQSASELVLVEPAWSPDDNSQAIKRIHRLGQDSPCRARIFGVAGTLDEAIMSTLAVKIKMQTEVGL